MVVVWIGFSTNSIKTVELHVSAASSLQESLTEIAALFMTKNPHVTIRLNFAGSNQLQQQIVEGFPVNLFLSAHVKPYLALMQLDLIKQGEPFAKSPVVLVTSTPHISSIYDLAGDDVALALAGEDVPIGVYKDIILNKVEFEQPGFRDAVLNNVITRAANVRQALLYVTLKESDATFVYRTDLTEANFEEVTVIELPPEYQVMGTFYLALINQDNIQAEAREFYDFILSDTGQEVWTRYGFR